MTDEQILAVLEDVMRKQGQEVKRLPPGWLNFARALLEAGMSDVTKLTDDEKAEILDWVSACQSAYHIDSTQGHRFGGLGSNLEENRNALIEYVDSIIEARLVANGAEPIYQVREDRQAPLATPSDKQESKPISDDYTRLCSPEWIEALRESDKQEAVSEEPTAGYYYHHGWEAGKAAAQRHASDKQEADEKKLTRWQRAQMAFGGGDVPDAAPLAQSAEQDRIDAEPIYQVFEPCEGTWTDCDKRTYDATDGAFKRAVRLAQGASK